MFLRCTSREQYEQLKSTREFGDRWMLDLHLAARADGKRGFSIPGVCVPCGEASDFAVSFDGAWHGPDGLRLPNWRETAVCARCGMNARQRRLAEEIVSTWSARTTSDGRWPRMPDGVTSCRLLTTRIL